MTTLNNPCWACKVREATQTRKRDRYTQVWVGMCDRFIRSARRRGRRMAAKVKRQADSARGVVILCSKGNMRNPWKKMMANVYLSATRPRSFFAERYGSVRLGGGVQCIPREVSITASDLKRLFEEQEGRCFWFQTPLNPYDVFISGHPFSPSVDRLETNEGYILSNVVIASRFANLGRGRLTVSDMRRAVRRILGVPEGLAPLLFEKTEE